MDYALLIKPHANARYNESLRKLALAELRCLLHQACPADDCRVQEIEGYPFLVFSREQMDDALWRKVSRHSSVCLAGRWADGRLEPIKLDGDGPIGADLSQALKYKGKTNADFSALLLNCTRAASRFADSPGPLTVLDPMCGRGTGLFCAWAQGENAIGMDSDDKALHEADTYLSRYLQFHRRKHRREEASLTLPKRGPVRETRFVLADAAPPLSLRLWHAEAALAGPLLKREGCHLIVTDLPYGVQHAPSEHGAMSTLERTLRELAPSLATALREGGAVGLAFNIYTLPRETVTHALQSAGLEPLEEPPFCDFAHWVEQAVNRDVVIARK